MLSLGTRPCSKAQVQERASREGGGIKVTPGGTRIEMSTSKGKEGGKFERAKLKKEKGRSESRVSVLMGRNVERSVTPATHGNTSDNTVGIVNS